MPIHRDVNKEFFKIWTHDMAYVVGFFAADGNIIKTKRNTHFIAFHSADKNILTAIQKTMCSAHKLSLRTFSSGSVYRFQIGSKDMYKDLVKLGFSQNKSRRMIIPTIPQKYVRDFTRGYFDGDGNVWIGYVNKNRKTPSRVITVSFTSGSKVFLMGLWKLLKLEGIKGGTLYTSKVKDFSRLTFSTYDALKLGKIMYNGQPKLFLQRKRLRFDTFVLEKNCGGSSTG